MEISAIRGGSAVWQKKPNPKDVYKPTVLKAGLRNLPFLKDHQFFFCFFILQGIDITISLAGWSGLFQLRRSNLLTSIAMVDVSTYSSAA